MSNVTTITKSAGTYARDLFERVLATFVVTAAGLLVAAGPADMLNANFWEGVGAAGLAAVGSLVKGLVAKVVGDKNSASAAPGV